MRYVIVVYLCYIDRVDFVFCFSIITNKGLKDYKEYFNSNPQLPIAVGMIFGKKIVYSSEWFSQQFLDSLKKTMRFLSKNLTQLEIP